jgi:hypothetical protein
METCKTCEKCRYYLPSEPGMANPEFGMCQKIAETYEPTDYSSLPAYGAFLRVRPTFGCNCWKACGAQCTNCKHWQHLHGGVGVCAKATERTEHSKFGLFYKDGGRLWDGDLRTHGSFYCQGWELEE